jgi:hypothetical protein
VGHNKVGQLVAIQVHPTRGRGLAAQPQRLAIDHHRLGPCESSRSLADHPPHSAISAADEQILPPVRIPIGQARDRMLAKLGPLDRQLDLHRQLKDQRSPDRLNSPSPRNRKGRTSEQNKEYRNAV